MKVTKLILSGIALAMSQIAMAGGILTNTNQSISFLRNPARDGAIGIDGVYSNPAGVAFLNDGFHLSLNWQAAFQTREITSTNQALYPLNLNDPSSTKFFKGKATAPVIPSVQAAYNTGKWSLQFNFAVHGGGGKCEFGDGIGTFDEALGGIAHKIGANGYTANSYMQGKQYYFGVTLGAAYKVTDNLSVYGGLRALYGSASYKATIKNIMINAEVQPGVNMNVPFDQYLASSIQKCNEGISALPGVIAKLEAAGVDATEYKMQLAKAQASLPQLQALEKYSAGVNLQSDQTGFGIAPIIGVDYKIGNFNFAAKYEFRTRMSMKNESTLTEAGILEPLKKFEDDRSIREDNPASLSFGAQWSVLPNVRVNAGYHHFYDKQSKKYGDEQDKLSGGTNEYLGGIEWDPAQKLTVSGGFQITKYGLTDSFMNDMSFVVDSWSFGLGAAYQVSDKVKVQLAYFQTNYEDYKTSTPNANGSLNNYTRTNRVLGLGVDLTF